MSYKHIYTPVAFQEYSDAISWYTQHSSKAAVNFVTEVNNRIQLICIDPYRYRNNYKNFYEVSVRKFPFYIIYFIDKEKNLIVIASVYHHKRSKKRKY
jgi:mRNA-degrading endonuclease RelE of RelBE toxin-antitoxin system